MSNRKITISKEIRYLETLILRALQKCKILHSTLDMLTVMPYSLVEHENKGGISMNINRFTQNSIQAVQNCEKIAADNGNQELSQEHLLYALLTQDDSLILKLFEKMNIQGQLLINRVDQAIGKRPKVQGGQLFVGQDLNNVLIHAEDEAKQMGDEYVSVEHLFLSLLKYASKEMKQIYREFGISREGFLHALSTVRGNQRAMPIIRKQRMIR